MTYEPVIGLEVHCQLATATKIFSPVSTEFGAAPNSQISPICAGMPGVLPVLNRQAVEFALRMGLATNCTIASHSLFARKHYFYPDLPKGYQISQYEEPLCENGWVEIELETGGMKRVGIIRIHLEEDAGKSVHDEEFVHSSESLVDLNRCGVPLIEIVSAPDIASPREAFLYLRHIRQLVRYLGICDGNMEEGSLRCDANVSVRRAGDKEFGVKTEIKNMNSFRNVEHALTAEIERQIDLLESDQEVVQETRLWDGDRNVTVTMRTKEDAHDYRYFPDPDLVPLRIDEAWRGRVQTALPELPRPRRNRLVEQYGLSREHAEVLTEEREIAEYFEIAAQQVKEPQKAANWVLGEVRRALGERKVSIADLPLTAEQLAELIRLIENGTISDSVAKKVFEHMLETGKSAKAIVTEKGLEQISDSGEIIAAIDEIIASNSDEFARLQAGESKLLGFFVGQVMRATKGKANPQLVNELLRARLKA